MINTNEAPVGFYAISKNNAKTPNVCDSCEAIALCRENKDNWCLFNRCMSYEVVTKDGQIFSRKDKQSVFFKRITELTQQ